MTDVLAPRRTSDRLMDLCEQFAEESATEVEIPLTQIDLAQRWNISRSSVQKFLDRKQKQGQVICKHPLRLNASVIMGRPCAPSKSPPFPEWLDVISAALVASAEAGHLEVVLALEERLFDRLASRPQIHSDPTETLGASERALTGAPTARRVAFSANHELELEEIHSDSVGFEGRAGGRADARQSDSFTRSAQEILRGGKTPEQTVQLVQRRIQGRELRPTGATPPWLRSDAWSAPSWAAADVDELRAVWQRCFPTEPGDHLLLALRLWPPQAASVAVEELAATTGLRNYEGQLLDAAVWGYHKYFPVTPALQVEPGSTAAERLAAALHSEGDFVDPEDVQNHIASLVSLGQPPAAILERLAMQLIHGRIPAAVLSSYETHEWTPEEIEAEACRILETLGETP